MEIGLSNYTEKADTLISNFFSNISSSVNEANKTVSVWREVLLSIKSHRIDGSQLADHSRIIELKNGNLLVETDHPGRIQLFQMYKNYIQTGINRKLPELEVKNIVFRLKKNDRINSGKNAEEIIRERFESDNIDDDFEKKYPSSNEKGDLPDEIKAIFNRMKNN